MLVLVHDFSGHPFQAQLSRELSRRGHDVTHSYCEAYTSGKGQLQPEPGETIRFEAIGTDTKVAKESFWLRLRQEARFGRELIAQVKRLRPEVVLMSNTPLPTLLVLVLFLKLKRIPWVLWHQDVQAVAIRSFAGNQLSGAYKLVGSAAEFVEKWLARQSAHVVAIADPIYEVHKLWGTADRTTVIPNWAPVDEIRPVPRENAWAREQGVDKEHVLLYSGTLGLKHNPALLVEVARGVMDEGVPVRLVVVNEGPAAGPLTAAAEKLDVPLTLLPFQPYERLPEVLGSGDVLVVLLEKSAGSFSVPSKTLSYLCAGRPILGLMPPENAASTLVEEVGGCVLPPDEASVVDAAKWVANILTDPDDAARIGRAARDLAEREFSLDTIADRFEAILAGSANRK